MDYTINFMLRKDVSNKNGEHPIILVIYQNGKKVTKIGVGISVANDSWVNGKEYIASKGVNKSPKHYEYNILLSTIYTNATNLIYEAKVNQKELSIAIFKEKIFGKNKKVDFFKAVEDAIKSKEKKGRSTQTLRSYGIVVKRLKLFKPNFNVDDIDDNFLFELENHLKNQQKHKPNTVWGTFKGLKTLVIEIASLNKIKIAPFGYMPSYKHPAKNFLTQEEVTKLYALWETKTLSSERQNVLAYFLFACFTGLDYNDISGLEYTDIDFSNPETPIISRERGKTKEPYIVPIIDKAIVFIDMDKREGKVFKVHTNQNSNHCLKEIALVAGITKKVTFHIARHSFGTLSLNFGISRDVVKKMMGHRKDEMSQHYAKVQSYFVIEEMKKWNNQK